MGLCRVPGSGIGAWRSGLGVGLGVLACGFESFGGISVLLCMGVVGRVVGHVWRVGKCFSRLAQWVKRYPVMMEYRFEPFL